MTSDLVLLLARLNIVLGGAILLVLVLRWPIRRFCGADVAYALWTLVPTAMLGDLMLSAISLIETGKPFPLIAGWTAPQLPVEALYVWAGGMGAGLLLYTTGHLLEARRVKLGKVGPAVVGLLNPRICLPSDFAERFTPSEQRLIREHERAHLVRNDVLANALMTLLRCVLWFNPLVHLAGAALRHDQEMACDAQVMDSFPDQRRRYAEAMLKAQMGGSIGSLAAAFARHPLEGRIAAIARGLPSSYPRILGIMWLCAGAFYLLVAYAMNIGGGDAEAPLGILLDMRP